MDPVTAAGISLSVASLALQAFAGCVKGYNLFAEAKGMPADYHHLRIRLKIEQERLLHWGEKVGLEQERLKNPGQLLQQNGNLIIDIMLEMQATFRETIKIEEKYDQYLPQPASEDIAPPESSSSTEKMLKKTLKFLERVPETNHRLTWAMVKKDKFKDLIDKLIGFNTYIEGLLDKVAMEQLQFMQQQTYMALLQLNSNVAELKKISSAIMIKTSASTPSLHISSDTSEHDSSRTSFARLAEFKAQQLSLDEKAPEMEPIESAEVHVVESDDEIRSEGMYLSEHIWIEWKDCDLGNDPRSDWNKGIEKRVKKLAILLSSDEKPEQFGAPHCLGYFNDEDERYGFLYRKPKDVPPEITPTSLHTLLDPGSTPSLTKRITLAHSISRCLMYLHSVNWLHKGLRSHNILFFIPPSSTPEYHSPIISGFAYARPNLPEEKTDRLIRPSKDDIYRHPDILRGAALRGAVPRSQKSHDIYSLGVVLVEIACWQPIDKILGIGNSDRDLKGVSKVRERLLNERFLTKVEGFVGEVYGRVVRRCLVGGRELGLAMDEDEEKEEVGRKMQAVLAEEIVGKLGKIRI